MRTNRFIFHLFRALDQKWIPKKRDNIRYFAPTSGSACSSHRFLWNTYAAAVVLFPALLRSLLSLSTLLVRPYFHFYFRLRSFRHIFLIASIRKSATKGNTFIRLLGFILPICVLFHHKHQCIRETNRNKKNNNNNTLAQIKKDFVIYWSYWKVKCVYIPLCKHIHRFVYDGNSQHMESCSLHMQQQQQQQPSNKTWSGWKLEIVYFRTFNIIVIGAIVQQQNDSSKRARSKIQRDLKRKMNSICDVQQWHTKKFPK